MSIEKRYRMPHRFKRLMCVALLGAAPLFAENAQAQSASEYVTTAAGAAVGAIGISRLNNSTLNVVETIDSATSGVGVVNYYVPGGAGVSSGVGFGQTANVTNLNGAQIITSQNRIPVEVQKGSLIRLSAPASTVFITNPDIADVQIKSPTLIYVFGKAPGETALYALSANDEVLFNGIVSVKHNLSRLQGAMRQLLPGSAIVVNSVENSIVLTGRVGSAVEAEDAGLLAASFAGGATRIINRVQINSPVQVNLRVRIAEVSREIVKQIGFRWDFRSLSGDFFGGFVSGAATTVVGNSGIESFLVNDNTFTSSFRGDNFSIDTLLDALETEGLLSMLAEPNLTALSGETASFLAGGEFPIPVPQKDNAITITFKRFGIGLAFTPTVLSDQQINLKINPEVSQLTSAGAIEIAGFSVPALTTRTAETTVELGSGQSFAIAGLIQSNVVRGLSKLPGLGDLPILGALFRSDEFQREETELVIIVTPYIVRPVSAPRMALPTDGIQFPGDVDRILKGESYIAHPFNDTPVPRDQKGRRLIGPAGYSLN